jgi:hypothetical protein
MHSSGRKHPRYVLAGGKGRTPLCLVEAEASLAAERADLAAAI